MLRLVHWSFDSRQKDRNGMDRWRGKARRGVNTTFVLVSPIAYNCIIFNLKHKNVNINIGNIMQKRVFLPLGLI